MGFGAMADWRLNVCVPVQLSPFPSPINVHIHQQRPDLQTNVFGYTAPVRPSVCVFACVC